MDWVRLFIGFLIICFIADSTWKARWIDTWLDLLTVLAPRIVIAFIGSIISAYFALKIEGRI